MVTIFKIIYWEQEDPIKFLKTQIIKGDSQMVPNILSDDDIFVRGERQKPITKQKEEWSNLDNIPLVQKQKNIIIEIKN